MTFLGSLLLFVSVVCAVAFPIFAGHGVAIHQTRWVVIGAAFGAVAAVLFVLQGRIGRKQSY